MIEKVNVTKTSLDLWSNDYSVHDYDRVDARAILIVLFVRRVCFVTYSPWLRHALRNSFHPVYV